MAAHTRGQQGPDHICQAQTPSRNTGEPDLAQASHETSAATRGIGPARRSPCCLQLPVSTLGGMAPLLRGEMLGGVLCQVFVVVLRGSLEDEDSEAGQGVKPLSLCRPESKF